VIDAAARRQKWIDQAQSVNLWLAEPDLRVLSHMYRAAWRKGLKTTYYLRTLGASNIEKAGTTHYSAGEMVEYFQRLGMSFGADTNAHTWWRETVYKLELPRTDEPLLRDSLLLLRDYSDRMLLADRELENERGVILAEKRDRTTPTSKAGEEQMRFLLPESLIPRRYPIGDEGVITYAQRPAFVDYYRDWYSLDRLVVVAVGSVDPVALTALLNEYFGDMVAPAARMPEPDLGRLTPRGGLATRLYDDPDLPEVEVEILQIHPLTQETDSAARRIEAMYRRLALNIVNRRLEALAREEGAPFVAGTAYAWDFLDFARFAGIGLRTSADKWEQSLEVASREMRRARDFGFTSAEVTEAVANMRNGLEEAARRAATRKSREISDALGRALIDGRVFMHPAQTRDTLVPALDGASPQAITSAFRDLWSADDTFVWVQGNLNQKVAAAYRATLDQAVTPPTEADDAVFAYTDFGQPGTVRSTVHHADLGIDQAVLANGVRVNLMPTTYESGTIRITFSFGNGQLAVPLDRPELQLFANATFIDGGLQAHSRQDLRRLLAGRTVGMSFGIGPNAFTLGGATNRDDFLLQMQVLTAWLTAPGYRVEAERVAKRGLDALYNQLRTDPNAVVRNEVDRMLAGGDPRVGYPPRAAVDGLTMADVAAWLDPVLRDAWLEVSIVGDFQDADSVWPAILATVGALPARSEQPPSLYEAGRVAFPHGRALRSFTYEADLPQAQILAHWPTVDRSDIARARLLSVVGSVFSDRLRVRVREEIGEAYSPYAFHFASEHFTDYGYLRAVVSADPARVDTLMNVVREIASDLSTGDIGEDELVRTIEPIKTSIRERRRNNRYWLESVLQGSQIDAQKLEAARSFAAFYDTVQLADVNALAQSYVDPQAMLPVLVVPAAR
jgi:zinc protease